MTYSHRLVNQYHRVAGAYQDAGMKFAHEKIQAQFKKLLNSTDNKLQDMMLEHGVDPSSLPKYQNLEAIQSAKDSLGLDSGFNYADARVNYIHDRILENLNGSNPVNVASFKGNLVQLAELGSQMGDELLEIVPEEYKEHLSHINLDFKSGTSFRDKTMARLLKAARSLALLAEQAVSFLSRILHRYLEITIQFMRTALELPIHIPFFTHFWKTVISPGSGELCLLSVYGLIGTIPATLFYKLYRKHDPVTEKDLIALESNKVPQLFLYTWNNHPLTKTNDPHEIKRRAAVFDWIPRMNAAYMLSFAVHTALLLPTEVRSPFTGKNIINEIAGLHKTMRMTFVFLICIWVYPVSQLETNDMEAVIRDIQFPEPRIQAWWYSYQIGLTARLMAVRNQGNMLGKLTDNIYCVVIGTVQGLMSHSVMKDMIKLTHPKDWKRMAVTSASIMGWEADTLTFFAPLLPPGVFRDTTEILALRTMIV